VCVIRGDRDARGVSARHHADRTALDPDHGIRGVDQDRPRGLCRGVAGLVADRTRDDMLAAGVLGRVFGNAGGIHAAARAPVGQLRIAGRAEANGHGVLEPAAGR
jgi:hypothetical protein